MAGDAAIECDHAKFRRAFFSGASVLMVLHFLDFLNNALMAAVWLAKAPSASLWEKIPVAKLLSSLDAIKTAAKVATGRRKFTLAFQPPLPCAETDPDLRPVGHNATTSSLTAFLSNEAVMAQSAKQREIWLSKVVA